MAQITSSFRYKKYFIYAFSVVVVVTVTVSQLHASRRQRQLHESQLNRRLGQLNVSLRPGQLHVSRRRGPVISFPDIPTSDPFCSSLPRRITPTKDWEFDNTRALPSKEEMCYSSQKQLESLYHRYLSRIQVTCLSRTRVGRLIDGGKELCKNKTLIPDKSCLVYSFGIDFEFSFDDAISKRFGCEVHCFDPSMGIDSYNRTELIHFHNIGLSDFDGLTKKLSWKMRKLETIRKELNHNERDIDLLKIDIEQWEWVVLPDILKSLEVVNHVKQIVIEFHLRGVARAHTKFFWIHKLFALKELYDRNYRIFWITKQNCYFAKCYELSLIRIT